MQKKSLRVIAASVGLLAVLGLTGAGCSTSGGSTAAIGRDCCPDGIAQAPASPVGWVAARSSQVSPLGDAPNERDLGRDEIHPAHASQTCTACASSQPQVVLRH